ncbi:MAG: hypothetical protein LBK42_00475 [Propionibacteriaceae bacterium]|jgi:hypothetical protein|nr:hypothetical protein [Propionibacteriaceae bacterium]
MDHDLSSWGEALKRSDFRDYYQSQFTPPYRRYGFVMAFFCLLLALAALSLVLGPRWLKDQAALIGVMSGSLLAIMAVGGLVWWHQRFTRNVRLNRFCSAHGLGFQELRQDVRLPGAPFRSDRRSLTQPIITGGGLIIGRHRILEDQRQNKIELYRPFTFGMIRLPQAVPHIILKNRHSKVVPMSRLRNIAQMALEGDFADTFTLYCPASYERDALYIFTPDVMTACLDLAGDAELELVDDYLFLYTLSGEACRDPEKLLALRDIIERLAGRFGRQVAAYSDDRSASGRVAGAARRMNFKAQSQLVGLFGGLLIALYAAYQILSLLGFHLF